MSLDHKRSGLAALTLGAIGVVYGDIGTSPLYTLKEVFLPATGVALNGPNLVGATSVIVWALMLVVTLKYVILILRADNRGEGGALALTALAAQAVQRRPALRHGLLLLGLFGATLFYGDSVITPAISVMGAIEGLEVITPALKPYVLPISTAILVGLFLVQRFGTAAVGKVFGPVIVLWFGVLGVVGAVHIVQEPRILAALNPLEAWHFLSQRGWHLFAAVGAIVLALTGAEALYADMGHFGRQPIRLAWTTLVFPSLALNYLGQGALLMRDASAIENPFFRLFPSELVLPMVVLAAMAAVIASQAVISGAYSMTKQAILLGFLPRLTMRHTSASESGQIYVPAVNWALLAELCDRPADRRHADAQPDAGEQHRPDHRGPVRLREPLLPDGRRRELVGLAQAALDDAGRRPHRHHGRAVHPCELEAEVRHRHDQGHRQRGRSGRARWAPGLDQRGWHDRDDPCAGR